MTNIRRFEILASGFVRNKDIVEMLGCSKATASGILKDVKEAIAASGKKWYAPYADAVPVQPFLDLMGWDEAKIHLLAMREAELKAAAAGTTKYVVTTAS